MNVTDIAFWIFAAIAVVSGWRVFCTDSMVRASFLLMLSFIAVGLIMVLLNAPYLGIATVFMMEGWATQLDPQLKVMKTIRKFTSYDIQQAFATLCTT